MNLIDTNVKPDPFNPQLGDVYEYDAPPQGHSYYSVSVGGGASAKYTFNMGGGNCRTRIVVTNLSNNVWLQVNGEERLQKAGTFRLFIASLTNLAAVGRVRETAMVTEEAQS